MENTGLFLKQRPFGQRVDTPFVHWARRRLPASFGSQSPEMSRRQSEKDEGVLSHPQFIFCVSVASPQREGSQFLHEHFLDESSLL